MKSLGNSIKCIHCGAHVFSESANSYVKCPCGTVAIGGGRKKLIRYALDEDYEEKSIVEAEGE